MKKLKISIIEKKDFPFKLKRIKNCPIRLYTIGNKKLLYDDCFGIVGTRKVTSYGIKNCEYFSKEFALRNIPVVSGMAIGTDTVAHKAVLAYQGKTIAVLGSGFNYIYPEQNVELFNEIIEKNGLVITEYAPNEKVNKSNFPKRNRIISAISEGILVIEAGYRSGTSITANNAIIQGKKVFAIPGQIDSSVGIGVNNLLKKGAVLTTNINDILINYPQFENKLRISNSQSINSSTLNIKKCVKSEYKIIYKILEKSGKDFDEILQKSGLEFEKCIKILSMMEIEEMIINKNGIYIIKEGCNEK